MIEVLPVHHCQHGKGEPVHDTIRRDELLDRVRAMPCCSKSGSTKGRHDPGCWAGALHWMRELLGDAR